MKHGGTGEELTKRKVFPPYTNACFRHGQVQYQKTHRQWHENQEDWRVQEATESIEENPLVEWQ
ncbi:hypothetical protein [Bacteroides xylanisolvens]|uniref:hypothetical protein n=1 Tax=Bacteroides xylanisolvens TaxID=371601 RepID=UPI001CE479B1|nr:hypothetical protein [Bacteroides xylanisolvens]